jgi:hypothetical protein
MYPIRILYIIRSLQLTVQKLINKHKIILHALLIKLVKIRLPQRPQAFQKLKNQRRVGIAFGHRNQVYVFMSRVAEGGASESENWRANGGVRDDLDAEDICKTGAAVGSKGSEDEILAFLVEDENAGYHYYGVRCFFSFGQAG